jgi:hypothetical protein
MRRSAVYCRGAAYYTNLLRCGLLHQPVAVRLTTPTCCGAAYYTIGRYFFLACATSPRREILAMPAFTAAFVAVRLTTPTCGFLQQPVAVRLTTLSGATSPRRTLLLPRVRSWPCLPLPRHERHHHLPAAGRLQLAFSGGVLACDLARLLISVQPDVPTCSTLWFNYFCTISQECIIYLCDSLIAHPEFLFIWMRLHFSTYPLKYTFSYIPRSPSAPCCRITQ